MYLIYVDESGKPNIKDPEDYILGALIIKENQWQQIDQQVKLLKKKWFPALNDKQIELHASDITHQRKVFKDLTQQDTFNLLNDISVLISNIFCVLIASIIRKNNIYPFIRERKDINDWIERKGHMILFERICKYLNKVNRMKELVNEPIDYGILIIDSVNNKYDEIVRKKVIKLLEEGTFYVENKYLIENPIFVISKYRNLIQLADFVSLSFVENIDNLT